MSTDTAYDSFPSASPNVWAPEPFDALEIGDVMYDLMWRRYVVRGFVPDGILYEDEKGAIQRQNYHALLTLCAAPAGAYARRLLFDHVAIEMKGLPPVRGRARSILAPRHPHANRVKRLLRAAASAVGHGGAFDDTPLAIDVIVRIPESTDGDALGFVDGIVTTLQLEHLGLLTGASQIREIRYGEEPATDSVDSSYTVYLRPMR